MGITVAQIMTPLYTEKAIWYVSLKKTREPF